MSGQEQEVMYRRFFAEPISVAVGTPQVVDVRGLKGFTIVLNGGTATYQMCDAAGTVITGSTSDNAVTKTLVAAAWPFYLITATTAACTVATVG